MMTSEIMARGLTEGYRVNVPCRSLPKGFMPAYVQAFGAVAPVFGLLDIVEVRGFASLENKHDFVWGRQAGKLRSLNPPMPSNDAVISVYNTGLALVLDCFSSSAEKAFPQSERGKFWAGARWAGRHYKLAPFEYGIGFETLYRAARICRVPRLTIFKRLQDCDAIGFADPSGGPAGDTLRASLSS